MKHNEYKQFSKMSSKYDWEMNTEKQEKRKASRAMRMLKRSRKGMWSSVE